MLEQAAERTSVAKGQYNLKTFYLPSR